MVDTDKLIITQPIDITVLKQDGTIDFIIDELKDITLSNTEEKEEVTGLNGKVLLSIKKNKKFSVTATNGAYSVALIGKQTGGEVENGVDNEGVKTTIMMPEKYTVLADDEAYVKYNAVGDVGSEISEIFLETGDGSLGKRFTQDATPSAGKFSFDPLTKKIDFFAGEVPANTDLIIYYNRNIMVKTVSNQTDKFAGSAPVWINVFAKDPCQKLYYVRFIIPQADFDGNFDVSAGDTVGVQSVTFTSIPPTGKCAGSIVVGNTLWSMVVFGADDDDAI